MSKPKISNCLSHYFRCPEQLCRFALNPSARFTDEYFQLGNAEISYRGHPDPPKSAKYLFRTSLNALHDVEIKDGTAYLPFDPSQVAEHLRCESYACDWRHGIPISSLAKVYYLLRPVLPFCMRKQLQKFHLRGWRSLTFPKWPIDTTVDDLMMELLSLAIKATGAERIPFIWFWPRSAPGCAIVTHDVETKVASDLCERLMDIDDLFGITASFQVIPEYGYTVRNELLESIRNRGFEIAMHDLEHDGHLYANRKQFANRATKINAHAEKYGAQGFRAGHLYRRQLWYDALKVSYDMSIPNVSHLDPQRGGCCTVMPYFRGDILELPVTTTQDYALFHILGDDSIDLWKQQIEIILEKHGLMSFVTHPDHLTNARQLRMYEALLAYLGCLQDEKGIWITTPGEANRWWRQRAEMNLVYGANGWRIEGPGAESATVAYAVLDGDRLVYEFEPVAAGSGGWQ